MKWKNVSRLVSVYIKADRLLKKNRLMKYREKRWGSYLMLAAICLAGAAIGLVAGFTLSSMGDTATTKQLYDSVVSFFFTLPVMCILYSLILTQLYQFQRAGVKASTQPVYWFPVSWGEHTMASVITGMIGTPLYITGFLICLIVAMSSLIGLLPIALLTAVALFACMFMTSATTEILKTLQQGMSGAVMKAAGRAAVWVRFFATLLFITVIYVAYFLLTQSNFPALIASISSGQLTAWFIPYVWPGIILYSIYHGQWLVVAALLPATAVFIMALFFVAAGLNSRYGMWEPAAISVSRGTDAPKSGLPGRLGLSAAVSAIVKKGFGLSAAEIAIVKKDFRSYTRRTELMYVFITPIVFIVMTFMPMLTGSGASGIGGLGSFLYLYLALAPGAILAATLGTGAAGSEGAGLWVLSSSPLTPKNFIRGKFVFTGMLSMLIALLCAIAGFFLFSPSARMAATGIWEAFILIGAVAMVSLFSGVKGADFRESARMRMVRAEWSLLNTVICMVAAFFILSPVIAYGVATTFAGVQLTGLYLYVSWAISGAIAIAIAYVVYGIAVKSAGTSIFTSKE